MCNNNDDAVNINTYDIYHFKLKLLKHYLNQNIYVCNNTIPISKIHLSYI